MRRTARLKPLKASRQRKTDRKDNRTGRTDSKDRADRLEDLLWDCIVSFEGRTFFTVKNLAFTYTVKGGELFIDRKEKSVTRATVMKACRRAMELGGEVAGPKTLGTFGASYLYPIFVRIGIITEPPSKEQKN